MKKTIIILLIIFLFAIIKCDDNNNINEQKGENNEEKDNNNKEQSNEEENQDQKEEENAKEEEEQSGFYISEKVFDEKLKNILDEKNLKPKKKITKEQLRTIFNLIYKKQEKAGEEKGKVDPETGLTSEQQNKQYMDSIFNEVAKSLDYDDKIRVREIKEWIHPIRVQEAYAELLQGLAETMGYL